MKITINQTANDLDPNNTASDPDASLKNYVAELSDSIRAEYPDAIIDHVDQSDTYAFRVTGSDDHDDVVDFVQRKSESIYEAGNFWV